MEKRIGPLALFAAIVAWGCGGGSHRGPMMMTGPSGMGPQGSGFAFVSVVPAGGATGVPTSTAITIRFGGAIAAAMEQYVDLHVGRLAGPTVPMDCVWSEDRTALTCTPSTRLEPGTTYVVHLAGGNTWGRMGPGWHEANGNHGMAFVFTTA